MPDRFRCLARKRRTGQFRVPARRPQAPDAARMARGGIQSTAGPVSPGPHRFVAPPESGAVRWRRIDSPASKTACCTAAMTVASIRRGKSKIAPVALLLPPTRQVLSDYLEVLSRMRLYAALTAPNIRHAGTKYRKPGGSTCEPERHGSGSKGCPDCKAAESACRRILHFGNFS